MVANILLAAPQPECSYQELSGSGVQEVSPHGGLGEGGRIMTVIF